MRKGDLGDRPGQMLLQLQLISKDKSGVVLKAKILDDGQEFKQVITELHLRLSHWPKMGMLRN